MFIIKRLTASVVLFLLLAGILPAQEDKSFHRTYTLYGISFEVSCDNNSSLGTLTVKTEGLVRDEILTQTIDGTVNRAEIADMNSDGAPEIYIFITSSGSGSYGSVIAYSSNRNQSVSKICFPEDNPKEKILQGYMGHDRFTVRKHRLERRFPLYRKYDTNAFPAGRMQTVLYKLVPGEATWQLQPIQTQ